MRPQSPVAVAPGGTLAALGSMRVAHVGFAVTDAYEAARAYSDVFGIPMPMMSAGRDLEFPPGSQWNEAAQLRVAHWQQGEVGMELIESVGGPTPWSEYLEKQKGNTAYSIAFDVGDRMDEILLDLQTKGARWIYGKPGGTDAYLDFTETLGLIIEIMGTAKSAPRVR